MNSAKQINVFVKFLKNFLFLLGQAVTVTDGVALCVTHLLTLYHYSQLFALLVWDTAWGNDSLGEAGVSCQLQVGWMGHQSEAWGTQMLLCPQGAPWTLQFYSTWKWILPLSPTQAFLVS